jgi:hypothetical protein
MGDHGFNVIVPEVRRQLCSTTDNIVCMDRVSGVSLSTVCETPTGYTLKQRQGIVRNLVFMTLAPLYHSGIIYSDSHVGNFFLCKGDGLGVVDFGSVKKYSPEMSKLLMRYIYALANEVNDSEEGLRRYIEISKWFGFYTDVTAARKSSLLMKPFWCKHDDFEFETSSDVSNFGDEKVSCEIIWVLRAMLGVVDIAKLLQIPPSLNAVLLEVISAYTSE